MTENTLECDVCATSLTEDDAYETEDGRLACSDCFRTCERCSTTSDVGHENYTTVDDQLWCEACTDYYAHYCDSCNEWSSDYTLYIQDRSESFCESCTENYATYCEYCDEYNVDGCSDCEDSIHEIHDYSYRPDPVFHSTDKDERLFFGIEIEMESPHGDTSILRQAAETAHMLEDTDHAYLKSDGSLNCGMELVTHPMSHDYYQNEAHELWGVLDTLRDVHKMRAWDASTAGLHIHISRTGFSGGAHMHRFLNLVYSNEYLFSELAGRNSARWAKYDDVVANTSVVVDGERKWVAYKSFKNKIEHGRSSDRYSAVNTQNAHTLEMRIFRSSINKNVVKAQISLAHASVEYTRRLSLQDIKDGALKRDNFIAYIISNAETYPELTERINRIIPTLTTV